MVTKKEFQFYGVCHNKFKLDDIIWEAIEDENDGYRSCLETIKAIKTDDSTFTVEPFAIVKIIAVDDGYFRGHHLVDVDGGHIWLKVGTANYDDYYPCFTFQYDIPKYLHAKFEDLVSE